MSSEQLRATTSLLQVGGDASIHTTVHEARKAIKRLRALDRVMAQSITPAEHALRRDALRQAAQRLAAARDAEVALSTLEALIADEPHLEAIEWLRRLRAQLSSERTSAELAMQRHAQPQQALAALRRLQDRPSPRAPTDEQIASALERIYRRARRAMKHASSTNAGEDLHTWRKRVKDLRHALEALTVDGAKRTRREAKRAAKLGELLGEEHDLEMLASRIATERDAAQGQLDGEQRHQLLTGSAEVLDAIGRRKKALSKDAFRMGRELLAESPRRFSQRLLGR